MLRYRRHNPVSESRRHRRRERAALLVPCALALLDPVGGSVIRAQEIPLAEAFRVEGVSAYDTVIPTPEDLLGYTVGSRHTRPEELVRYFEAIAERSDRVRFARHGTTHEGRPLVHAIVSSPRNLSRLESIRLSNLRLFGSPQTVSDRDIAAMPAVVYLAYSVHGNEASGSEASLLALYHLAAGQGPVVESVLSNLVVIIDPSLNPDGRDRFVDWVNRNRGTQPTTDPQDREHNEPWPGGRTNHYWFDLNRDWLPVTQPESDARLRLFSDWRPQLLLDFHEMGREATFFFQPGIPSRTNPNTPQSNQDLTARIASYHARAFDRVGQPYYSGESFDDFFYGKGSTYPDLNGAVGILFEQASSRALAVETYSGELRYPRTIRNQFIATLSSLEAAVDLRGELLSHQREFYERVEGWADEKSYEAWMFARPGSDGRSEQMAGLLATHGIATYLNSGTIDVQGDRFRPGEAWIAPLKQPQGRLLQAMMERTTEFRDSVFYDVSAWTLPLAYDVRAYQIGGSPARALGEPFRAAESTGVRAGAPPTESGAGWLVRWGSEAAARGLTRWLRAGFEARVLVRPIGVDQDGTEQEFPAGTLVLAPRRDRQLVAFEELEPLLTAIVAEEGVELVPVASSLTASGPDLGGPSARFIRLPEVAILTGDGLSSNRAGELWHLLDHETGIEVSLLDQHRISDADLDRYEVLFVAGGTVSEAELQPLVEWVDSGGTLIALGSSMAWAVREGLLPLEERPFDVDSLTADADWADLGVARGAHAIAGTILRSRLDGSHPLAFGIGDELPLFVTSGRFFDASPKESIAKYDDRPRISGWLSAARESQAAGATAIAVSRQGSGRVIGIHAYPAFRGYWKGGARLIWNAVFFGWGL